MLEFNIEYRLFAYWLIQSIVIAVVPKLIFATATSISVVELFAATSKEAYTSVPLTIISVIFSDLLGEASFLLSAKLPLVSIEATKAS